MDIKGKNITVVGAERSGIGAAKLISRLGGHAFVSDKNEKLKFGSPELLKKYNIEFELGKHSDRVYDCEFIVTSPGVPSDSDVLKKAIVKNIPVYSEMEFASWYCSAKIISITGTNGKTTTTALIDHILNSSGFKSTSAGNIGLAFSEIVLDLKENEYAVLETSSFQLDSIYKFKPFISIILNITPDHLDRYQGQMENYINSKISVTKNQDFSDYFVFNKDDKNIPLSKVNNKVQKYSYSLLQNVEEGVCLEKNNIIFKTKELKEKICAKSELSIKGEHNLANSMAAVIAAKLLNVDTEKLRAALGSFKGVEHRLEFVRDINGVKFINDSKATNVDSVWFALRSFDTPIHLILGGQDKGNDYNQIKPEVINKVKKIYAIGVSAEKIFDFFREYVNVQRYQNMNDAVLDAREGAKENEIVLLSPACASFDMFDNYEHRGKVFKKIVMSLN